MARILKFPQAAVDIDRVRLDREEPCLVLILPVVRIERDESAGPQLGRCRRLGRFLDRVLDGEPT